MNSVYLVLDMQNDTVHADGKGARSPLGEQAAARGIVGKTARAIAKAQSADISIGFVRVGFSADYHECPKSSPLFAGAAKAGLLQLGTWGTETHPDLVSEPSDIQVVKHRVSPFYATSLVAQLSALKVERIYCSGVSTQAVVQATVRDAHDRDFDVVVLEDCCAAHSEQEHLNSIGSIARFCRVTDSEDVTFKSE